MKLITALVLFLAFLPQKEPSLDRVRILYKVAAEQEEAAEKLQRLLEPYGRENPVFLAYKGAGYMLLAKHVGNPFKKMSYFKKGKETFTAAINEDKENPELRFLRFAVQSEAPAFLGYRDNLEEDKQVLLAKIRDLKDKALKKMILNYLLNSEALTSEEKEGLTQ